MKSYVMGIDFGAMNCRVALFDVEGNILCDDVHGDGEKLCWPTGLQVSSYGKMIDKIRYNFYCGIPTDLKIPIKSVLGKNNDDPNVIQFKKYYESEWSIYMEEEERVNYTDEKMQLWCSPEYIASSIFRYIKLEIKTITNIETQNAVITVPRYFNEHQRTAMKEAARMAGLNPLGLIEDPIAAALAYCEYNEIRGRCRLLVYDFGASSLTVSVVDYDGECFQLLSSMTDMNVSGQTLNAILGNHILRRCRFDYWDSKLNDLSVHDIHYVENTKKYLSLKEMTEISVYIKECFIKMKVSRYKFESLILPILHQTLSMIDKVLIQSNTNESDIDHIVLVGGSCNIPKIRELLAEKFDRQMGDLDCKVKPEHLVVRGAAIQASRIQNNSQQL